MKLKHFALALIFIIISVAFIIYLQPNNDNGTNTPSTELTPIQKAIELILEVESARRGKDLDVLESVIAEYSTKNVQVSDLFYLEFIKGYIASANNKFVLAEQHFAQAELHIYPTIPSHILSRFYYENSYIEMEQKQYDESNLSYQEAEKLFTHQKEYSDAFISISLGRTYDLAHIEKGSALSIQQAQKTLEFAKQIQYAKMEQVYFILGLSYWNNNQTILGIDFKLKALDIYLEKNQVRDIVYTLTDIGIDYLFLKNYNEGIRQLTQALEYLNKSNHSEPVEAYYITYKLYSAYLQIHDMENAKYYLYEAERQLNALDDSIIKENFYTNQLLLEAEYLSVTGQPKKAIILLKQASQRHENGLANSFYHFDVTLFNAYGKVYHHLGLYKESIKHHILAKEAIQKRELFYLEDETYFYLYESYAKLRDYQHAVFYLKQSHNVKTKQLNDNNQAQTQFLLHTFDTKKKESRILELEQRTNKIISLSGLLLLIIIVIASFTRLLVNKNKEINALNSKLHDLSLTDGLTDIPNRRALELHLAETQHNKMSRSIMMIDVDHFKKYNDTYGHKKGDEALIAIAQALKSVFQHNAFLGRFGGEEFIVIMDHTNQAQSIMMAKKLQTKIASLKIPHSSSEAAAFITLSIGITTYKTHEHNESYDERAIIEADKALYYSKHKGRNQYNHFYEH